MTPQMFASGPANSTAPSVDQLVATRVAAGIAERAELPIARNIAEISISLSVENQLAQADNNVITKPQIIQPSASSREIRSYTTVTGDSVDKLAAQFGVSADTIKWANNLTSDALEPGKVLQIPSDNGVFYTVKDGDTTASIAERYKADERRIILYNDLESDGLAAG
jgi:LysM repeat protein